MAQAAILIVYALGAWWVSTGVILYVVSLSRRTYPASLLISAGLAFVGIWLLLASRNGDTVRDAYTSFSGAIMVWGFVEMTFLTGVVTGSRTTPCPPEAAGLVRARYATETIIYHELALIAAGLVVAVISWGGSNLTGLGTFAILWVMRLSSKLNLFLGVRTLNDELLPAQLAHLSSYFRRARMNAFYPISIIGAAIATIFLVAGVFEADASPFQTGSYTLLATLLTLAIAEHVFMMMPWSVARLWGMSPVPVHAPQSDKDGDAVGPDGTIAQR